MPQERRSTHNTHRLPSYTFQPRKLPCFFHFAFLATSPLSGFLFPPLSIPCGACCTVGQSGSMAVRAFPYGRCHAQVIRPHYEDIRATLINGPDVLPLNLACPSLSCAGPGSVCALTCSTAWCLSFLCSSKQIVDFTLWLEQPNADSSFEFTLMKSNNKSEMLWHSISGHWLCVKHGWGDVWHCFEQIFICMLPSHTAAD